MALIKFLVQPVSKQMLLSFSLITLASCNKPPTKLFNVYTDSGESSNSGTDDALGAEEEESESKSEVENTDESQSNESTDTGTTKPVDNTPVVVVPTPTPSPTPTPTPTPTPAVPAVEECANKLSVGRIYQWIATSEGQMLPSSGTIVVKENGKNVAKVKFIGNEWHVLPTWLKNTYEAEVDLSASKGFTLTYSATADLYLQLRPSFAWSGGDKYLVKIPSTGGVSKSLTVDFKESSWTTLDSLGKPSYPLAQAVKQARGFVFVGNVPNDFAVTGLSIDGYTPPCP